MVLSRTISYKQKPRVRDVADRDMFILKPDECILKPDKTVTIKTKFLRPHRAPIKGLIALPHDWKQVWAPYICMCVNR